MKHAKELEGMALDWAVAMAEGLSPVISRHPTWPHEPRLYCDDHEGCDEWSYNPSENWAKGGPLIEKHKLSVIQDNGAWRAVKAWYCGEPVAYYPSGETHLIAACRAIVAAKFPNGIEVPTELLK